MVCIVGNQHVMDFMFVHQFLHVGNLCVRTDGFRRACHDVAYRAVEELSVPFLHSTADVTIGDESLNTTVLDGDTQSQLALADVDDCLAQMHVGFQHRQMLGQHHVLSSG